MGEKVKNSKLVSVKKMKSYKTKEYQFADDSGGIPKQNFKEFGISFEILSGYAAPLNSLRDHVNNGLQTSFAYQQSLYPFIEGIRPLLYIPRVNFLFVYEQIFGDSDQKSTRNVAFGLGPLWSIGLDNKEQHSIQTGIYVGGSYIKGTRILQIEVDDPIEESIIPIDFKSEESSFHFSLFLDIGYKFTFTLGTYSVSLVLSGRVLYNPTISGPRYWTVSPLIGVSMGF